MDKEIKAKLPPNVGGSEYGAKTIERRYREAKAALLQPWTDQPTGEGVIFGPMLFNGRPVPKPIGLTAETTPKAGRPKKNRTA